MFDSLDRSKTGFIGHAEVKTAVTMLNAEWGLEIPEAHVDRCHGFLATFGREPAAVSTGCAHKVHRHQFVDGIQQLAIVLKHLEEKRFTFHSINVVFLAAFDRFDTDGNGTLNFEEVQVGFAALGINLATCDLHTLYRFFSGGLDEIRAEELVEEAPIWEQWQLAARRAVEDACKQKGVDSTLRVLRSILGSFAAQGTVDQRLQRAWGTAWENAEEVYGSMELLSDAVSMALAVSYIAEAGQELTDGGSLSHFDVATLVPLLTFVGLCGAQTAKELNELVPRDMTRDEAQLFAQVFNPRGVPQFVFRRLLSCPGFKWMVAERGDVLSGEQDSTLKMLVRGSMEARRLDQPVSQPGVEFGPGCSIGETALMGSRDIWDDSEVVVATDKVLYACWDLNHLHECLTHDPSAFLPFNALLANNARLNLRKKLKLQQELKQSVPALAYADPDAVAVAEWAMFDELDFNHDGQITFDEFTATFGAMDTSFAKSVADQLGQGFHGRMIERLFALLDEDRDGFITPGEFGHGLREMAECIECLNGLTIVQLECILHRAFIEVDANGDGQISREEFEELTNRLGLVMTGRQLDVLHSFFDMDKDGYIGQDEWAVWNLGEQAMVNKLGNVVQSQAGRGGLTQLAHLLESGCAILAGPGEPAQRIQRINTILWNSLDVLGETANAALDASGSLAALAAIWRECSGLEDWGDVSSLDVAPFMLFSLYAALSISRELVDGTVSDLSEKEALLYARVFQQDGITISEFKNLLKHGQAKWEHFDAGDVIGDGRQGEVIGCGKQQVLRVVVRGACEVRDVATNARFIATQGTFLGSRCLLSPKGSAHEAAVESREVRATAPSTALALNSAELRRFLEKHDALLLKVNRLVLHSDVDLMLGAGPPAPAPAPRVPEECPRSAVRA